IEMVILIIYKDFVSPFPESSITPISDNNNLDINNDIINESELYNENSALETDDISTVSKDDLTINHDDNQNESELGFVFTDTLTSFELMKWNIEGNQSASSCNLNELFIWENRKHNSIYSLHDHTAAIQALS
ncbi:15922_t:CDS:2, partial [Entrophospora sp. SA101]